MVEFCTLCKLDSEMHVCTSQLVLPIVFIVHLFNIVFYFIYYPYGLLSEIKYYYYYYYYRKICGGHFVFLQFFFRGGGRLFSPYGELFPHVEGLFSH